MKSHFDFTGYYPPPKGWTVLQHDRNGLMLERNGTSKVYYVTAPEPLQFVLCYTSEIQRERQFVMRTDSFLNILKAIGAVRIDDLKPVRQDDRPGNPALI